MNQGTGEPFEIQIVGNENGKVAYENLPEELAVHLINYSDKEKWEKYIEVLECIFALHASMNPEVDAHASMAVTGDLLGTSHMSVMPSDEINEVPTASEFEQMMK